MVSILCGTLVAVGQAHAGDREKVATFVVGGGFENATRVEEVVAQVRGHLLKEGKHEVQPLLERPATNMDPELVMARGVGQAAYAQLAEGKAPEEVLRVYGSHIANSISHASVVYDPNGRALLWNLCALNVHLLMLTSRPGDDSATREAVLDCTRRFADRPNVGKAWLEEVRQTFERFASEAPQVQVAVTSTPAGCELKVYGASVGVTPLVVDMIPGEYELRLDCAGRTGAIHRVDVQKSRELAINIDADDAFSERAGASWLEYRLDAQASVHALEHIAALAREASADSFVVVRAGQGADLEVLWMKPSGTLLAKGTVDGSEPMDHRAKSIAAVFNPTKPAVRRIWADHVLAAGLVAAGGILLAYPVTSMVRDGRCVDLDCDERHSGMGWKSSLALAGAVGFVAIGIAAWWVAPRLRDRGRASGSASLSAGLSAHGLIVRGGF